MPRLRRADCSLPGIRRIRRGRGFAYVATDGEKIDDAATLTRIRALAIPPAWQDVWICPYDNGHIQAVGTDAAGRRQYLYHAHWRERRDQQKFEHMLEFARALPDMRVRWREDLATRGLNRRRVLACAARLLDRGFFRIGSEGYAEQNRSYGLATMRRRHATVSGNEITFDYVAKYQKRRIQSVVDPEVARIVRTLKTRRGGGEELLAFRDGSTWIDVKSNDINEYLRATGGDYTAKDFRTWSATVLGAVALAVSGEAATTKTARKRAMARAVQEVAHYLGNTPAVCRASYIDPRIFDRYLSGWTIAGAIDDLAATSYLGEPAFQGPVENAVLDLLEDRRDSPAMEKVA